MIRLPGTLRLGNSYVLADLVNGDVMSRHLASFAGTL
jgi:hypothetical protein